MSVGRSYIRGPRFALKAPEKMHACEKCVYGTGQHAEFCDKRTPVSTGRESNAMGNIVEGKCT